VGGMNMMICLLLPELAEEPPDADVPDADEHAAAPMATSPISAIQPAPLRDILCTVNHSVL
jgi:hypothetical protein